VVVPVRVGMALVAASSTGAAILREQVDLVGCQHHSSSDKHASNALTPLSLVDTVQGDVFAFLRKANQRVQHVELVPSQPRALVLPRLHNLKHPRLRIVWQATAGQQLLCALNADTAASTVAGVQHRIERIDVGVGDV
jgi:hypothetical protein